MSFNIIGMFIFIGVFLPRIITVLGKKKYVHLNTHKQLQMIEFICLAGMVFFSIFTIGYGYSFYNFVVEIVYVSVISFIGILYYGIYVRFIICKRDTTYLYKRYCFIPYPEAVFEGLIFIISSAMLFNPYVIFFSIIYTPLHIYLETKRSGVVC